MKIAKADLVPTDANLLEDYGSFTELEEACRAFCEQVNARLHRETPRSRRTGWPPSGTGCIRSRPSRYARRWARNGWSGTPRRSFGSAATPPRPATRAPVWCVAGRTGDHRPAGRGAAEVARHRLSTPGSPPICDAHYPPGGRARRAARRRPRTQAEAEFLAIGDGAQRWLAEAAASGASRIRSKMARAVELAAVVGAARWTRRSAWPRWPAGSPTATWPRSSTTWPPNAPPASSDAGRPTGPAAPPAGPGTADRGSAMTLRQPHQDALLPAGDAARMRQALVTCSQLLSWADANCGPQFTAAAQEQRRPPGSAAPPAPWPTR